MTKPSAMEELAALRFRAYEAGLSGSILTYRDKGDAIPYDDAARIITAQEQRLDWTRKERDEYDLMSIKLCEERDALLEKVEQQEQRIGELEQEKRDGFCSHLEVLCGECTQQKGFAIWHRPPSCEENQ